MKKTNQRARILFEGVHNWGMNFNGELTKAQKKAAFDKCIRMYGVLLPYTITYYYELL